jgi:flagellar biosynthesis/type III secretory pathway protein FliH
MSNNKQSSVEWLISQLQRSKDWQRVLNEISQMSSARVDIIEQAKEMEVAGKEMSYADGYKEGYNRAIELTKWTISNLIPPPL